MAHTQADLDALKALRASGTLRVRFADGREVTYRSGAEIEDAISRVSQELASASGRAPARFGVAGFVRD